MSTSTQDITQQEYNIINIAQHGVRINFILGPAGIQGEARVTQP